MDKDLERLRSKVAMESKILQSLTKYKLRDKDYVMASRAVREPPDPGWCHLSELVIVKLSH